MLTRLVIHDVVLIEKLTLSFEAGLNVFTGETGAGKSIVLDSLGLALGARSDAAFIRKGAAQASVTAEFSLPEDHDVFVLAEEQGLVAENPVILRRVVSKDGRSRAFFNDQPVGVGLLRKFGERLLEVHGQFETYGLLDPASHRDLLDAFARAQELRAQVSEAFGAWQHARNAKEEACNARDRARAEEGYLQDAVKELEDLAPVEGEEARLVEERSLLQNHAKIVEATRSVAQYLDGEGGAIANLSHAGKVLAKAAEKAVGLSDVLAVVDRALDEASEASRSLDHFLSGLDLRPDALQRIDDRFFALRSVARKHGVVVDALPDVLADLSERLALISDGEKRLGDLEENEQKTRKTYCDRAKKLSAMRKEAAAAMERQLAKELPPLKLEAANLTVDFSSLPEAQWNEGGMDAVTFLASTNVGSAPGALHKIASGGELSRFMLALKTVLAAADPIPVLVFDEVDAGIGGAVASAVGHRLARLAGDVQVLVVTHSPQVAARGTRHFSVAKSVRGQKTVTDVSVLDRSARREEIARMLAGAAITDAARQAADSLLDEPRILTKTPSRKAKK